MVKGSCTRGADCSLRHDQSRNGQGKGTGKGKNKLKGSPLSPSEPSHRDSSDGAQSSQKVSSPAGKTERLRCLHFKKGQRTKQDQCVFFFWNSAVCILFKKGDCKEGAKCLHVHPDTDEQVRTDKSENLALVKATSFTRCCTVVRKFNRRSQFTFENVARKKPKKYVFFPRHIIRTPAMHDRSLCAPWLKDLCSKRTVEGNK